MTWVVRFKATCGWAYLAYDEFTGWGLVTNPREAKRFECRDAGWGFCGMGPLLAKDTSLVVPKLFGEVVARVATPLAVGARAAA